MTDLAVLADLRRSRRRRRTADFDPFEALYRVYITAILSGLTVWLLSGVTGDHRVGPATVAHVQAHGPQVVGAVVGAALAIGARSGGRGGPLVLEAADVRHVLLSPLPRAVALRAPAIRQLRFGALVGLGVGAVTGLLAFRRLPGHAVAWLASGAAVGALTALGALGLAMIVSGRQVGRWVGDLAAVGLAGWSAGDAAAGVVTSPATLLGQLALWPQRVHPMDLAGAAVVIGAAAAGVLSVGGTSVEAAERRAALVGQIRFAATLRDLRTVVVLRRQLAQELPRQRPWIRLRGGAARPWPMWRRGWHGILRFPAVRFVRLAVLGAGAGAAAAGVRHGTTPLVAVVGLALYVAGLDALEPVAQELDHPDRRDGYPLLSGVLYARQLGPPMVVMAAVGAVGLVVGAALGGSRSAWEIGAAAFLPAAWCGLAGALITVTQGPPPLFSAADTLMPPEAAGARAVVRMLWPPVVATIGALPLLAGRHPHAGQSPVGLVAALQPPLLLLLALVAVWLRYRDPIHAWFRTAMREATEARERGGGGR